MSYQISKWLLTDIPEDQIVGSNSNSFKTFTEEGTKTVKITGADFHSLEDQDVQKRGTFSVSIECIEGGQDAGAKANLVYWLIDAKTGKYNLNALGTMTSLGRAIFGKEFPDRSVPLPVDIIGAVAMADISFTKPNAMGKQYVRAFKWSPASLDFMGFSDIEQYYREVADDIGSTA